MNNNTSPYRHKRIGKTLLIAAVIAALFVGMCVTAYALNLFGFRDMIMGERQNGDRSAVSLSTAGISGNDGYEAGKEWFAYRDEYIAANSHSLDDLNDFENPKDPAYLIYGCADSAMRDKLYEIAAKYSLALHTQMQFISSGSDLSELSGIGGFWGPYSDLVTGGYVFEDGAFFAEFSADGATYGVSRYVKGAMPFFNIYLWSPDDFDELDYTPACGVPVHIIFSKEEGRAAVICDTDKSVLYCNIGVEQGNEVLTVDGIEAFVDSLDFSALDSGEASPRIRSNEKNVSSEAGSANMKDWLSSDEYLASAQWTTAASRWFALHPTMTDEELKEAEEKDYYKYLPRYELYCDELERELLGIAAQHDGELYYETKPVDFTDYLMPDADARSTFSVSFGDGSVAMSITVNGEENFINCINFGSFEELNSLWDTTTQYEEWSYKTASGEIVTIVMSLEYDLSNGREIRGRKSPHNIIIYRADEGWVIIDSMIANAVASDLEAVADIIDFTRFD